MSPRRAEPGMAEALPAMDIRFDQCEKTGSNVDFRWGAATIDENAENVRVAKRGPLSDRPREIA
jgi:hypothetical protein